MKADEALAALDAAIAEATPSERPGLVVALSARLAAVGASLVVVPGPVAPDETVSVEEAARRLGVSVPYVYRHAAELPAVRLGRRLGFSSRGLDALIGNRTRSLDLSAPRRAR